MSFEVVFYQFDDANIKFERAFLELIEGLIFKHQQRIKLVVPKDQIEYYDDFLWSEKQLSFIPHTRAGDKDFSGVKLHITDDLQDDPFQANLNILVSPKQCSDNEIKSPKLAYVFSSVKSSEQDFRSLHRKYLDDKINSKYYIMQDGRWKAAA